MEFPKIDTLYERGADFKVQPGVFKNRVYSLLKSWRWTEKIDGTNTRIIYTPPGPPTPQADIDSRLCFEPDYPVRHEFGKVTIGGRTDAANMPADLVQGLLDKISPGTMMSVFQGSDVVLFGEGYGGKIQSGSGYSLTKKFILFDILIEGKWWMNQEQITDIAAKLGLDVVPVIGDMSLEDATEFVRGGFATRVLGADPLKQAEGLVGRPLETLYDKRMKRMITKLKTKDF